MRVAGCLLGLCAVAVAFPAFSAADATRGAKAFQQCAACHSLTAGEHLTGPSLANVWGRQAGTTKDFLRYSDALKKSGVTWNEKTLDQWLTNPERFIPGNTMTFPGIKEPSARQDVIAYLRAASQGKAPAAAEGKGGMMMGRSQRANLKKADTDTQVVSLTHCRDTYTVQTAKGTTHKIWEFNLRLKTDSSNDGPHPGKPVITGSGMMGDRASVVFASPAEISSFIKESCH
jgi:cytochrome c